MDAFSADERVILSGLSRSRLAQALAIAVVALLAAIDVILLIRSPGGAGKIEPNRIVSPWEKSQAPPQFLDRSAVRVVEVDTRESRRSPSTVAAIR